MNAHNSITLILTTAILASCCQNQPVSELRAPSYPLITIDPYTSAWSATDNLYDSEIQHWTGRNLPLVGTLDVDGTQYRFLGVTAKEKKVILCTGETEEWPCRYTYFLPKGNWMSRNYKTNTVLH